MSAAAGVRGVEGERSAGELGGGLVDALACGSPSTANPIPRTRSSSPSARSNLNDSHQEEGKTLKSAAKKRRVFSGITRFLRNCRARVMRRFSKKQHPKNEDNNSDEPIVLEEVEPQESRFRLLPQEIQQMIFGYLPELDIANLMFAYKDLEDACAVVLKKKKIHLVTMKLDIFYNVTMPATNEKINRFQLVVLSSEIGPADVWSLNFRNLDLNKDIPQGSKSVVNFVSSVRHRRKSMTSIANDSRNYGFANDAAAIQWVATMMRLLTTNCNCSMLNFDMQAGDDEDAELKDQVLSSMFEHVVEPTTTAEKIIMDKLFVSGTSPILRFVNPRYLCFTGSPSLLFDSEGRSLIEGVQELDLDTNENIDRLMESRIIISVSLFSEIIWSDESVGRVLSAHMSSAAAERSITVHRNSKDEGGRNLIAVWSSEVGREVAEKNGMPRVFVTSEMFTETLHLM